MFVPKSLVVVVALVLSSVVAAPTYYERSEDVELEARQTDRFKQAGHAVRIKNQVSHSIHPKSGEAVFWSGNTPDKHGKPVSARVHAEEFSNRHPGHSTINHSLAKSGIHIPDRPKNKYSDHMWDHASKTYADRAHGDTHVILGKNTRPNSVYNTIEKPALMGNSRVSRLTEHHMGSGSSHVIKGSSRGHGGY